MSNPSGYITDGDRESVLPERLRLHLEGEFAIEGEVGRGGMATVWRATRRRDNALVAIKVLRPALAEAVGSRRFLREIQIAANTRSEFLVPLEESGEFQGLPYYVMPFIHGEPLRQRMLRERQLSLVETVRIGREIAVALAALHRNGIVHRDVKPDNVLLRDGKHVLVADYGIARALEASANDVVTSTGVVVGTPAYMSPEQAAGDPVDARTDQYSWGCILYEMLAGAPPFYGATSQAIISRHRHEPPPSLRIVRQSIPESLEAVVRKTMSKVPADRYATFDELIDALDAVDLANLESVSDATRRSRRTLGAVGVIAGVALIGWLGWRVTHPELDDDRVALFPFTTPDTALQREVSRISGVVRGALDEIEPGRFVDGSTSSGAGVADLARLPAMARRMRARFYVGGTITRPSADSVVVRVTLGDNTGNLDTAMVASGAAASVSDVALAAAVGLLPRLTGLQRQIHPSSLTGKAPAAMSHWLRGEREYRSSRMRSALDFLQRAVAADSSLAPAAIRGAMAAIWLNDERTATQLALLARRHGEMLTASQSAFAEGLRLYLVGAADSAVVAVRNALAVDSTWAEPWMLAGEIFFHLQPRVPLDSQLLREIPPPRTWPLERWARDAFLKANALDAGFTPPLLHLAQMAARRGDVNTVQTLQNLMVAAADSGALHGLTLTRRCLSTRMSNADWSATGRADPRSTYFVATILTNASASVARSCAWNAWSALAQSDSATTNEKWAAVMGRFSMSAAEGAHEKALAIVDSAVANGMNAALGLYFLGAAAGIDPGNRVDGFVGQLDAAIDSRPAPSLWLLALWSARTADTTRLRKVRARLSVLTAQSGTRLDTLIAHVTEAYDLLARRDTTRALRAFARLESRAAPSAIPWTLWESLAPERLIYARLLMATSSPSEAHRIATVFDQPGLYLNPLFLRPSLELRAEAARALGDDALRRVAEDRLRQLTPASR